MEGKIYVGLVTIPSLESINYKKWILRSLPVLISLFIEKVRAKKLWD